MVIDSKKNPFEDLPDQEEKRKKILNVQEKNKKQLYTYNYSFKIKW